MYHIYITENKIRKQTENSLTVVCETELKLTLHGLLVTILGTDALIIPHKNLYFELHVSYIFSLRNQYMTK